MSFFKKKIDIKLFNEKLIGGPDKLLGVKLLEYSDEERFMRGAFTVTKDTVQPYGLLHGGVSCLVAESMASIAGDCSVDEGHTIVGQSLTANHIRSGAIGDVIIATAYNVHMGRRSQVWNVELIREKDEKLVSQVTLTLSVISKGV
mgnify:CR=1 FL=1